MKNNTKTLAITLLALAIVLPMSISHVEAASGTWTTQFVLNQQSPAPTLWIGNHYPGYDHSYWPWMCTSDSGGEAYQPWTKSQKVSSSSSIKGVRVSVMMKTEQWSGAISHADIKIYSSTSYWYPFGRLEYQITVPLTLYWIKWIFSVGTDCKGRYLTFIIDMDEGSWFYFQYQYAEVQTYASSEVVPI